MALTLTTAGESHGPGLTCIVEGMPAGLVLEREALDRDLGRRQLGHGRGGRMKIERDRVEVSAGVRHGRTLGGPIALNVTNRDFANWEERMNPWPVEAQTAEVHLPRPGHADLVGTQKYGLTDVRDILERASARETAARVAGGAVAKAFLAALGVSVFSHVIQITGVAAPRRHDLTPEDFAAVDDSPVRCLDDEAGRAMVAEINRLRKANESLGGVFEVRAFGLVPGLGSHVSWLERLDGVLGQAIMSIQAVKGAAVGDGIEVAGLPGSEAHDEIFYAEDRGFYRETNRAGGLEGGMTTGDPLVVRGYMKPLPTLTKPLRSVDIATHEPAEALRERTDSCTVPAAGVVGEAMVAFVLADAYRRKFGGDHIDDVKAALDAYRARIGWQRRVIATVRNVALVGSSEEATRGAAFGLERLGTPGVRVTTLTSGALQSEAARTGLAGHLVVWIDDDPDTGWHPWQAAADVIVPHSRAGEIATVLAALEAVPPGVRLLWATTAGGDYPVYIGPGLLGEPAFWPTTVDGRRFLVTDYNAGRLYAERLEPLDGRVTIMPGEQSKTIAHAEIVWTELARAGMTRADIVVALGGGVVGDLAGFCAATYQRGVRVVQVATTLVAQVDSAYGGKTGVDLPEAKNYVGAYHQPEAVLSDTDALSSLPEEELAAGYAEVVKTALIAGGGLWELVREGAEPGSPEVVTACAHTKLRIVARDERDGGARQSLNLGHTVGHAIEAVTGYAAYRHGEAVALGLLAALRLSGNDDLRAEVLELLRARGLPTELRGVDPDAVVMATARDKKRTGEGPVPFVLLPEPGDPRPGSPVAPRELIAAVRELAG